ncbi:TIGR04283 family arsenosugar biosynthesis glycosyltransferase [Facklamia sp. DSM 111018]|uniref:4,4'-diaponeurosporenoate glycosyltransferase n=1 Tax=Facklamia lactis TaxID=2749967 RepID=A0ABS0LPT3_9LACT|nr:TIGR04283 family arsenosugar biosynthesis glycosyltransferase [Facklamia lactis]MBG9980275.1 TIGR04283 family arsenosugar biosynthesis glycosyltransferase [Facklamia lactis]MBG9986078.1 TIGR04283 family arsenosugar biosynthesis glycosyltransferase [Facklamia lactis]
MKKVELSVVIPIYNEENDLPLLIENLKVFNDPAIEIIMVDGGSHDRSVELLQAGGLKVLRARKGRGNQLDYGARHSNGDNLLFLHSDSYFKSSPLDCIRMNLERASIGAFPLRFTSNNLFLKLIEFGSNWRLAYRQIAFGDQGIHMKKTFYDEIGGFKHLPLMEDYDFSIRSKQAKQKLKIAPMPLYTSARRFEQKGVLMTLVKMQYCQWLFRRNESIEKIMKIYYS